MKKLLSSFFVVFVFVVMVFLVGVVDLECMCILVWIDVMLIFNVCFGDGIIGQIFLENFIFNISGVGVLVFLVLVLIVLDGFLCVGINSFILSGNGQIYIGIELFNGDLQIFSLCINGLIFGLYILLVVGIVLGLVGGSFVGNISVVLVLEVLIIVMMIGGLGLIGFVVYCCCKVGDKGDKVQMNVQMMLV